MKTMPDLTEEQTVHLVRNALLVAGEEMGPEGDHWPIVTDTIHKFMQDWEQLKIERNVHEEMKKHLYAELQAMIDSMPNCPEDQREQSWATIKELQDIFDAYFSPIDESQLTLAEEDKPEHVRRAEFLMDYLEVGDE